MIANEQIASRGSCLASGIISVRSVLLIAGLLITSAVVAPASSLDHQKSISQFTHTAWSAKDGLPGPVRAIAQTGDGYLWLGTEAGLYRFDGLRFVLWESSFDERLPSGSVWSLATAHDGSLWIGFGSGGVSHLRDGRLRNFSPEEGVPAGGVLSIVEDNVGTIWVGGQYGFSRFAGGTWQRVGVESGYSAPGAQSLLIDSRGVLWVATDGINFGFSKDPVRRNTILTLAPGARSFTQTREAVGMVWAMTESPYGAVWIANTSGRTAKMIAGDRGPKSEIALDGEVMSLIFDNNKSLWIGLIEDGLRRVSDLSPARIKNHALDHFKASDGLSGGLVYSTFKDREGNIWFGTASGLDRFRENKVTAFSAREGLDPDQQLALTATSDGSVWLISYTRDAVRRFFQGELLSSKLRSYSQSDSTRILSLYADGSDQVWLGGNFKLANQSHGAFSYAPGAKLATGAVVEAITTDTEGGLWVATWITTAGSDSVPKVLRLKDGKWTDFSVVASLPAYRARVMYGDPAGRVWLGFEDGQVACYEKGQFRIYSTKDGLPGGRVLAFSSDRSGNIWIGGEGGLSRFDHGRFVTLGKENGLPGNSVSGIVEDDEGFLWLACSLGIFRVSQQELEKGLALPTYRLSGLAIEATDGLRGLPRQREPFPTATRAADGRLWFATTGGIAVVDPRNLPTNQVKPPVTIEAVLADERVFTPTAGLQLQPNTRNLQFSYAALSLTDPQRVQFRYKLEGYDDDWHGPVSSRQVTYTNLPPRDYRFRVIGSNNDGIWNEEGATLAFSISPAFYQTNWFIALCVLATGLMVWAAYQRHVRQIAARLHSQFEERLSERTHIAQDLHDTLLQGFISASMQLDVGMDQIPGDSPAKARLMHVLDLMRQVIEEGRNTVSGLRSTNGSGSLDLETALARVQQEVNLQDEMSFRVIVEGRSRILHPIVRDEVYRIAREALLNAFRHSQANSIEVEVEYVTRHLRVLVRDNGSGIDSDVLTSGREGHWGLSGMRERAEKIGGRLKVWSRAGSGTEVELSVPGDVAFETLPAVSSKWFFGMLRRRRDSASTNGNASINSEKNGDKNDP